MSITLFFVAVVGSIALWWLWHQGLFAKPWLEEGAPSDMHGMSTTSLPPSKIGLWVFLAVVSALFVLLISAYMMRMPAGDWLPLPLPRVLWFNTAMLVLSSIALYSAERAALSNNAQIITMGARVIGPELAKSIADAFLKETFDPQGRSAGNVDAIDAVDAKYNAR